MPISKIGEWRNGEMANSRDTTRRARTPFAIKEPMLKS
jgi:hypothetical protein